ncbi:MAG: hypothetical protein ABIP95_06010, partial [Pelobium sp.]
KKHERTTMHNIMSRFLIIILTILSSTITQSQTLAFDSAVKRLYFGVDIINGSSLLVDTFMSINYLHHNDTVSRQSNLNVSMEMKSPEAWSVTHSFSFTKSPITDLKIKSGQIDVSIGESPQIKKLLRLEWRVEFDNKKDADIFFKRLRKTFQPLSTKQKIEFDKDVGHIIQYSTRNEEQLASKASHSF